MKLPFEQKPCVSFPRPSGTRRPTTTHTASEGLLLRPRVMRSSSPKIRSLCASHYQTTTYAKCHPETKEQVKFHFEAEVKIKKVHSQAKEYLKCLCATYVSLICSSSKMHHVACVVSLWVQGVSLILPVQRTNPENIHL